MGPRFAVRCKVWPARGKSGLPWWVGSHQDPQPSAPGIHSLGIQQISLRIGAYWCQALTPNPSRRSHFCPMRAAQSTPASQNCVLSSGCAWDSPCCPVLVWEGVPFAPHPFVAFTCIILSEPKSHPSPHCSGYHTCSLLMELLRAQQPQQILQQCLSIIIAL